MGDIDKRFWRKVRKSPTCWLWTATRVSRGYGHFRLNGKMRLAHRVVYELVRGSIPKGMHVCHRCDNPPCVNPSHLFLGTNLDNRLDMVAKVKHPYGERHGRAKLEEWQVRAIRELKGYLPCRSLAQIYGVGFQQISKIQSRKQWRRI